MKAIIRKAKESDIETIYNFERAYIIEHEPDELERWENAIERIYDNLKSYLATMFVAEVEGVVAGHGYWGMYEGMPCIYSVYIDKAYRKGGIGYGLMEAMDLEIEEKGHKSSSLATLVSNPAQHLFDKCGYERTDVKEGWIHYEKTFEQEE